MPLTLSLIKKMLIEQLLYVQHGLSVRDNAGNKMRSVSLGQIPSSREINNKHNKSKLLSMLKGKDAMGEKKQE